MRRALYALGDRVALRRGAFGGRPTDGRTRPSSRAAAAPVHRAIDGAGAETVRTTPSSTSLQKPEGETPKADESWWQKLVRETPNCKSFTDGCRTCSALHVCSNIGIACQPKEWACNDAKPDTKPDAKPDAKPIRGRIGLPRAVAATGLLAALRCAGRHGRARRTCAGSKLCTAEKQMERRTGCLQSNVEFLQGVIETQRARCAAEARCGGEGAGGGADRDHHAEGAARGDAGAAGEAGEDGGGAAEGEVKSTDQAPARRAELI